MARNVTLQELPDLVGEDLGVSRTITMSQERINGFAEVTEDRQWIHLDAERAAETPFGGTIAHGFLTLSLLPMLSQRTVDVTGMKMKINYGLNKVRFPQPVPSGARVRDTITLDSVERKDAGVMVIMTHVIEIDGEQRPACIAESVSLMVEQ